MVLGAALGPVIVDASRQAFWGKVAPSALFAEITVIGNIWFELEAKPTLRHLPVEVCVCVPGLPERAQHCAEPAKGARERAAGGILSTSMA